MQLVCHLAGFRLQLTFQIKKSSYTIKIVLVKRLTRGSSKGLTAFRTGHKTCVCGCRCFYVHTCSQSYSLPPSQARSTAVLQYCLCCGQLPNALHFKHLLSSSPFLQIVQNFLCQILLRLKFFKRPSQLKK